MKKKLTKKENSWEDIPAIHQERILNSYKESFNSENWIEHEDVKKQHAQLLKSANETKEGNDWWDEMTAEQQADLMVAIDETEDSTKLTSHEAVFEMSRQWLNEDTPQ